MIKTTGFKRFLPMPLSNRPRHAWVGVTYLEYPIWGYNRLYAVRGDYVPSVERIFNKMFLDSQNAWRNFRYSKKGRL